MAKELYPLAVPDSPMAPEDRPLAVLLTPKGTPEFTPLAVLDRPPVIIECEPLAVLLAPAPTKELLSVDWFVVPPTRAERKPTERLKPPPTRTHPRLSVGSDRESPHTFSCPPPRKPKVDQPLLSVPPGMAM